MFEDRTGPGNIDQFWVQSENGGESRIPTLRSWHRTQMTRARMRVVGGWLSSMGADGALNGVSWTHEISINIPIDICFIFGSNYDFDPR